MNLRILVVVVIATQSLCLFAAGTEGKRPNIVLILADDVGREVLGCYGGTSYATPRLDRLAASGMRFEHAYAMPVCHPTRITLLTGQYPFRLGHPRWGTFPVAAERKTFIHRLKQSGYATAVAGKWQLALLKDDPDHPHRLGFDEYCLFGWHEGPRYYQPHIWQNGRRREDVNDRYGPDVYCEALIDFMKRKKDQPFFAFYSMALCHDVTDDLDKPVPWGPRGRYDSYAEMVAAMDQRVGRIIDAVEDLGLREQTLILFYADNGSPAEIITTVADGQLVRKPVISAFGDAMIPGGKKQLTDWGTRVPLIANWPGTVAPRLSDALVDASDFGPTFAELAGAELPSNVQRDGHSFAGELLGKGPGARDWVFAEHKGKSFLRNHRWKLYNDDRFFDVAADPDEARPLPVDSLPPDAARAHKQLKAQFPVAARAMLTD